MDLLHEVDNIQQPKAPARKPRKAVKAKWVIEFEEDEDGELQIRLECPWIKNDDSTLSFVPAIYLDLSLFISPETLLYALLEAQTTSTTFARKGDCP